MIYLLIFTHWIADFIFQTDDMAKNKSKSNLWLSKHIIAYMMPLWFFVGIDTFINGLRPEFAASKFVIINGAAHFIIDWFTSRFNSKMWAAGKVHEFFVGVGFDQALHMATLIATYNWLLK